MFRSGITRKILERRLEKGPILKRLREQVFKASTRILDPDQMEVEFRNDLKKAEHLAVIISPFLKKSRVEKFLNLPETKDALERGVKISVLTKPSKEVKNKDEHQLCIRLLRGKDNKIEVEEIEKLHFKGIFIDHSIVYIGSINPLSVVTVSSIPEDYMLRFESEALVDELADELKGVELKKHLGLE